MIKSTSYLSILLRCIGYIEELSESSQSALFHSHSWDFGKGNTLSFRIFFTEPLLQFDGHLQMGNLSLEKINMCQ